MFLKQRYIEMAERTKSANMSGRCDCDLGVTVTAHVRKKVGGGQKNAGAGESPLKSYEFMDILKAFSRCSAARVAVVGSQRYFKRVRLRLTFSARHTHLSGDSYFPVNQTRQDGNLTRQMGFCLFFFSRPIVEAT